MTGPGTNTSNVSQACAACKHQRRKCSPECPLAPFFPSNSHRDFLNSHKLFGVRNIMNTVRKVGSSNRENAVKSMILEANIRARDPVGGCYRIVKELELKISRTKAELDFVLHQLAMFRAHGQNQKRSCLYNDGMQNGIEGQAIQQPSYFIGESSTNIGESSGNIGESSDKSIHIAAMKPSPPPSSSNIGESSNKSIHMEALAAMKPSPPPSPPMECAKQGAESNDAIIDPEIV